MMRDSCLITIPVVDVLHVFMMPDNRGQSWSTIVVTYHEKGANSTGWMHLAHLSRLQPMGMHSSPRQES